MARLHRINDRRHAAAALAVVDAAGADEERVVERRSHAVASSERNALRSLLRAELAEPEKAGAGDDDDGAHNEEQDGEYDDHSYERG